MLSISKIIILYGVIFLLVIGCADENPVTETTYQDCTVVRKDNSVVKIIQPSSILSNNLTASNVCEIVQPFTDKQFNQALQTISTLCEPADKLVQEISNGNYKEAYDKLSSGKTTGLEIILDFIPICSSQSNRITRATETLLHFNIYSFGTFVSNGKECPGFLTQTTVLNETKKDINNQVHFLYGYGKCDSFKLDSIDNPIEKPNSILPGDKLRTTFKYNGLLPDKWIHNNKTYNYYTIKSEEPRKNTAEESVVGDIQFINPEPIVVGNINIESLPDKYPSTVAQSGLLNHYLRNLMGNDSYEEFLDNLIVASPVEQKGSLIFGSGMAPRSGGAQQSAFLKDEQGHLYAVIFDFSNERKIRIYGAPNFDSLPIKLKDLIAELRSWN